MKLLQVDKPSLEKVLRMIEAGKNEGAKLEAGGNRIGEEGFFVEPTVFSNVTDEMTIAREEVNILFENISITSIVFTLKII